MRRSLTAAVLLLAAGAARGRADVFELKDGGRLIGAVVARGDDGAYVVRTADGAQTTLARNQLQRVLPQDETALEYERRSRTTPDTADGHRALVAWCREHGLTAEIDHHLERIVDLDQNDEDARRSLGLERVGDRWLSRDEIMSMRGLKFFDGAYRTAQDIAMRQRDDLQGEGEANWFAKLRLWRGWLESSRDDRVAEAQAQIAAVADPEAAPAIVKLLDDEQDEFAFDLLLAALGRLDHPQAVQTLVDYSLNYEAEDGRGAAVRADCLDYLTRMPRPVSVLPYVQALKNKDNVIVNRAAGALAELGNPAAISPLIDALVTEHKYEVQTGGGPGQMNAAFDPSGTGGGGLSMGGGPKIVRKDLENISVLRALTKLSGGQNFEYDEQAWRRWYVDLQMRQHANARRDL